MATATATRPITAEEFQAMDLGPGLHELVRGEIVEMALPSPDQGRISFRSALVFEVYGQRTGLGYVVTNDSAIVTERGPDTVRGADAAFYLEASTPRESLRGRPFVAAPLVAIEVLSPSNRAPDVMKKVGEYLGAGVVLVAVLIPSRRQLALYREGDVVPVVYEEGDAVEDLPELPGFRCVVSEFFA